MRKDNMFKGNSFRPYYGKTSHRKESILFMKKKKKPIVLSELKPEELKKQRYERFRNIAFYQETAQD